MTLEPGRRLGPYEILAPIGAGGMGEVYRARDTRLDRTVAVKVISGGALSSPAIRQRFEREAKTISQLSHPHICALYDVGTDEGVEYLVMEYLEGETLADRLGKGALPLPQTLRSGIEIADALERAHRQGIIHRDLKPGNVMLTRSGVKLLDFGLARLAAPKSGETDPASVLPTRSGPLTEEGTILGTFPYMAPEQLEGKEADARTDIFAFGAVLYEMSTGQKAFSGGSRASLISAIMQNDPAPISSVAPTTPPALERLVRTCLAKDPDERWQSAGDVSRQLEWIAEAPVSVSVPVSAPAGGTRKPRAALPWAMAAAGLVFAAASPFLWRGARPKEEPLRFSITPPPGSDFLGPIHLSPDGLRVLFLLVDEGGKGSLAVRRLDSLEIRRLPGTEEARGAFWSPDGREIAFFSEGKLRRISADGGPVQPVAESGAAFSGAWGRGGTILFSKEFGAPIVEVSEAGGTSAPVTSIDTARGDVAHSHPTFLPDGRHFVFVSRNRDPEKTSILLGSLDSKAARRLFHSDSGAVFAAPDALLFGRDNALFAWKFDPGTLKAVGEPTPAIEQVRYGTEDNFLAASAAGNRVVYLPLSVRRKLVWVDRKGRELGALGEVGGYEDVRISPDGRRAAVSRRDASRGQNLDVWVLDVSRGTGSRITTERTDEFDPVWFPDGERLAYVADHAGFYDIFERPAGGGAEKIVWQTKEDKLLPTIFPDGASLLFSASSGAIFTRNVISLSGTPSGVVRLSAGSRFSEEHPEISPDGRWNAFDSSESGQREVFVQSMAGGPKRQVSVGGGQMPVWNRSGSELFYAARDGMLMSVPLRLLGGIVDAGEPQPLFLLRLGVGGEILFPRHPYDVAPDGQRFLVVRRERDSQDGAIVVTNWRAAMPPR